MCRFRSERKRMEHYHNILLVQMGDIGDVVLTAPTIHALKRFYPDGRVSILVRKPFGDLLRADPDVYEVVEFAKGRRGAARVLKEYARVIRHLRRSRYDLAIDLRTGDRGAFLAFFTGAPARIGYRGDNKKFWHSILFTKIIRVLSPKAESGHPGADQSLRILRSIGMETGNPPPRLFIMPDARKRATRLLDESGLAVEGRWCTINTFSRWKYKEWDSGKWGEVIDRLWENHGIPSLLVGSPEEEAASRKIVEGREGHAYCFAGKTTLGELAALISMSSLHVGVDSAAPHIALALGTPTVTIHGPSDWRSWRVIDDSNKVVVPAMDCVPCNRTGCDDQGISRCLESLEVEGVLEVIETLLRQRNSAV